MYQQKIHFHAALGSQVKIWQLHQWTHHTALRGIHPLIRVSQHCNCWLTVAHHTTATSSFNAGFEKRHSPARNINFKCIALRIKGKNRYLAQRGRHAVSGLHSMPRFVRGYFCQFWVTVSVQGSRTAVNDDRWCFRWTHCMQSSTTRRKLHFENLAQRKKKIETHTLDIGPVEKK